MAIRLLLAAAWWFAERPYPPGGILVVGSEAVVNARLHVTHSGFV